MNGLPATRGLPRAIPPPGVEQLLPARRPEPSDLDSGARRLIERAAFELRHSATADAAAFRMRTISIIVPTRNRARWLPYVFDAVGRQVYPAGLLEVLVVDDSSTDDTECVVLRWAEGYPFPLRYLGKVKEGPGAARNYGAAHAGGEVLAFTDSDCMPDPKWLFNGVRALRDGVGFVIGPIFPRRTSDTHFFFNAQLGTVLNDDGLYRTAGMLVPRPVFDAVGGFDPAYSLGRSGIYLLGEDTDFGWRIKRRGLQAVFQPDVVVTHLATPISVRGWLLRSLQAQTIVRLLRTIPELRATALWHRYFWSEHDFIFLTGLGGVVSAIVLQWWPLALLSLGFVWSIRSNLVGMLRKGRLDKAGAIVLLLLTRAAMNVLVLTYASARYRRLVL